jgi:hypothetical protein
MSDLLQLFLGYGGVGVLVMVIVTLLKLPAILTSGKIVILPDGRSGEAQVLINLALFVAFVVLKIFRPDFDFGGLDEQLKIYANYAVQLLGLLIQIWTSASGYKHVLRPAASFFSYSRTFERQ